METFKKNIEKSWRRADESFTGTTTNMTINQLTVPSDLLRLLLNGLKRTNEKFFPLIFPLKFSITSHFFFVDFSIFMLYFAGLITSEMSIWTNTAWYSWFHIKKGTLSVHLFNGDYLSIPKCTGSCGYLFMKSPVSCIEFKLSTKWINYWQYVKCIIGIQCNIKIFVSKPLQTWILWIE